MAKPVHILGAGSIGLLLAARLAPVADVTLIRRPGAWPRDFALTLENGSAERRLTLAQVAADALQRPAERIIVCTKAYDALPALQALEPELSPTASLLLMQNGMGSQEAVAAAFPQASIYAASSTEGAYRPAPSRLVHAGHGITRIGRLQGAEQDWVGLLRRAGFECESAEPIQWHLANKLRINALINPLTVLHACRNGELLARPEGPATMRRLGEEADAVLAAAGFTFPDSAFDQAAEVARRTAANISSMLQDARAGRPLELEAITGYLLQLAERHGLPAPENRAIYQRLAPAAHGNRQSGES
ncbi:MAG TPA: 2-dehydropantoate 2-reductase [Gammaproteobacteria bacterium]|nr:2-dehydropantoate 2-reductase [Gammaproteobacteria bacterium]